MIAKEDKLWPGLQRWSNLE